MKLLATAWMTGLMLAGCALPANSQQVSTNPPLQVPVAPALAPNPAPQSSPLPAEQEAFCKKPPKNNEILGKKGPRVKAGHKVTVKNGSSGDAIFKIRNAANGKLLVSFFVANEKTATISHLPDGKYQFQFAVGAQMTENCRGFIDPAASQFDALQTLVTTTKRTKKQIITSTRELTLTLYGIIDGNAPTSNIEDGLFNAE